MNIKIVYFAYLIPNKWESIVLEQLDALYGITDLYESATIFMSIIDTSDSQTELEKLRNILSTKYSKIQLINIFYENVYEYPGIKTLYESSTNDPHEYILYFHSKGMMSEQHDTRRILFQYTIKNYKVIIDEMEQNNEIDTASLIPCAFGFGYFNFFWARSSYINQYCTRPDLSVNYIKHFRFTWEMWLGNHYSNKKRIITYSPVFNYNQVFEEIGACYLIYLFLNNDLNEINKMASSENMFNNTISKYIKSMNSIADNKLTDKNTAHCYFHIYEKIFQSIRKSASNILEVGIYWGGSVKLWRDWFPSAQIYAVDICNMDFIKNESIKNDHNITLFTDTNGYDDSFIQNNFQSKNIKFDMILDDGPHTLQSNIDFINKYLPLLTETGILIIEDVQQFEYIELFKQIVPDKLKQYIQVYDLRNIKGCYDDILFVVNKSI